MSYSTITFNLNAMEVPILYMKRGREQGGSEGAP